MKRIILLSLLLFIYNNNEAHIKSTFVIEGKVLGLKAGSKLCMVIKISDKVDTISRAVASNGAFKFTNVKLPVYPAFYLICIQTKFVDNLQLFLDQAGDVKINGSLKNWPSVLVTGSKTHDDYLACKKLRDEIKKKDILLKYPTGFAPADTITASTLKQYRMLIEHNPDSFYLPYAIVNLTHSAAAYGYSFTPQMKKPLYDMLSPKVKESYYGKILAKQLELWNKSQKWIHQLKTEAEGLISLTPEDAYQQLQTNSGQAVVLKRAVVLNKQLTDSELIIRSEAATLIVNMAYKKSGTDEIQTNPTGAYVIDENGICVTNYHVLKEYTSNKNYQSLSIMTTKGESYPVTKILSCSESDDLVVFQIDTKGNKLPAFTLGNQAIKGSSIYVMGHPKQNFYTFTSGIVSENSTAMLAGRSCNIMSITADFNVGSSGGPILDDCGNVVGTVSRINGGMKVGVPVSELKKLIEFKK